MPPDVPTRHWYQNDPGIVPNLLITGAGSPTGICVYEGDSLPEVFQNQMIHCDAGPNIVRAYPVKVSGAGYSASIVNMMDGAEKNRWFRPSDVCVAPDGSLIVADWYDPGVGGHRMQDVQRGRLFRVTAKNAGGKYQSPAVDFSTPELSAQALCSPNLATRYLAWVALQKFGSQSVPALEALWSQGNPRHRARALRTCPATLTSTLPPTPTVTPPAPGPRRRGERLRGALRVAGARAGAVRGEAAG